MMYVHTVPIDNCNGWVPEPIQHIKFFGSSHRNVDFFFDGGKILKYNYERSERYPTEIKQDCLQSLFFRLIKFKKILKDSVVNGMNAAGVQQLKIAQEYNNNTYDRVLYRDGVEEGV